MQYSHIPVMLEESIHYLKLKLGANYVDCTLGGAGYTRSIAEKIGEGRVVAIDLDELAINNAQAILKKTNIKNVILVNDNFNQLSKIIKENLGQKAFGRIGGIVLDLGLSSAQLQDRSRGFSFQADTALDMSFGQNNSLATSEIINNWTEAELNKIFKDYGEERFARNIARQIIKARGVEVIKTTGQLVTIIQAAIPAYYLRKKGIHFATKTFQALRIATNDELGSLKTVLDQAIEALAPGGRLVVISYHSLEDRMVKHFFKELNTDCVCPPTLPICSCSHRAKVELITTRAIVPTEAETERNPRARSAKLRVVEKKSIKK